MLSISVHFVTTPLLRKTENTSQSENSLQRQLYNMGNPTTGQKGFTSWTSDGETSNTRAQGNRSISLFSVTRRWENTKQKKTKQIVVEIYVRSTKCRSLHFEVNMRLLKEYVIKRKVHITPAVGPVYIQQAPKTGTCISYLLYYVSFLSLFRVLERSWTFNFSIQERERD